MLVVALSLPAVAKRSTYLLYRIYGSKPLLFKDVPLAAVVVRPYLRVQHGGFRSAQAIGHAGQIPIGP